MTNYEKYKDIVIDSIEGNYVCKLAEKVYDSDWYCRTSCIECRKRVSKWLNEEYEPKVDWSKVPIDTPVIVWMNGVNCTKKHRYFKSYTKTKSGKDVFTTFAEGATSWSADSWRDFPEWDECELALWSDKEKYYI